MQMVPPPPIMVTVSQDVTPLSSVLPTGNQPSSIQHTTMEEKQKKEGKMQITYFYS